MKALYRLVAAILTVASAFDAVLLAKAATGGDDVNVLWFAVFALLAVLALGSALTLWARAARK